MKTILKTKLLVSYFLWLLFAGWGAKVSQAGFTYAVLLDQASYSTTVGGTFNVGLVFRQTYDGIGPASTLEGLSYWALGVDRTETTLGSTTSAPSFTDGLGGGTSMVTNSGTVVRNIYTDLSAPYLAPTISQDGSIREFALGTFNFGAAAAGTGTFSAVTFGNIDATFRNGTNDLTEVNLNAMGVTLGTATFTITAVPEPGTMLLAGLGLAGAGLARQFRRKSKATTA